MAERERDYITRCLFVARKKLTQHFTANESFFEHMDGDMALQLSDEIKKEYFDIGHAMSECHKEELYGQNNWRKEPIKDVAVIRDIEKLASNLLVPVKSNKLKDRLKRTFRLRFQNPAHEHEFEEWYTQQQLHSYAMIALYVIFFSCWHAFWDIYTYCDEGLQYTSPSLCLHTPTGWTILRFRIAYFAGIPLLGLLLGLIKSVPAKMKEIMAIILIAIYTYGHIYWSYYLALSKLSDNTRVGDPFYFNYCQDVSNYTSKLYPQNIFLADCYNAILTLASRSKIRIEFFLSFGIVMIICMAATNLALGMAFFSDATNAVILVFMLIIGFLHRRNAEREYRELFAFVKLYNHVTSKKKMSASMGERCV
jgi:hypothetical protein